MMKDKRSQSQTIVPPINFDRWRPSVNIFSQSRKTIQGTLPVLAQHKIIKKQAIKDDATHKKDLTTAIGRFKYLHQKQNTQPVEVGKAAIKVLQAFSNTQNNFQTVFEAIVKRIKVYSEFNLDTDFQLKKQCSQYYDDFASVKEGASFRQIIYMMNKSFVNLRDSKNTELKQRREYEAQIEQLVTSKYNTIHKLKQTIKYYLTDPNTHIKFEFDQLQREFNQMKEELERIYKERNKLSDDLEEADKDIAKAEGAIAKLKQQNKQIRFKMEEYEDRDKTRNDLYDKKFKMFKDVIDQLYLKVTDISNQVKKVKRQNQQLVTQRTQFVARSSVSFEELTPRPRYQKLIGVDYEYFKPTATIMQTIIEKFHLGPGEKKFIFEHKPENKLEKAEESASEGLQTLKVLKKQLRLIQN